MESLQEGLERFLDEVFVLLKEFLDLIKLKGRAGRESNFPRCCELSLCGTKNSRVVALKIALRSHIEWPLTLIETSGIKLLDGPIVCLVHATSIDSSADLVETPSASSVTNCLPRLALTLSGEGLPNTASRVDRRVLLVKGLKVFPTDGCVGPGAVTVIILWHIVAH